MPVRVERTRTGFVAAAAIDGANAAGHVVLLINLADAELRQYFEQHVHEVPAIQEAAVLCLPLAATRDVLRGLGMEADLDVAPLPGWLRVCVLGAWEVYAFVHVAIDPDAPDVGGA